MKVIDQHVTDRMAIYHCDCIDLAKTLPTDSIHYSVSSIPFASLYTYSNSCRDLGNCRTESEFYEHFKYMVKEWVRVTMKGRLISVHVMNLPTSKQNHGYIGIQDFRGDIIRMFQEAGMIYHSEVCIWKDPVTAMQRTKALGLLHKTIRKDSSMSRQGIPDYLVTFRKPGDNPEPIRHYRDEHECLEVCHNEGLSYEEQEQQIFPVMMWQRYASPVWMDINPSNTLQKQSAREEKDERHICPLQLGVIERGIELWSNPGDVVYDPFGGIGSTGYQALKMGRRTVMSELKESYYKQNVLNCQSAVNHAPGLFDE